MEAHNERKTERNPREEARNLCSLAMRETDKERQMELINRRREILRKIAEGETVIPADAASVLKNGRVDSSSGMGFLYDKIQLAKENRTGVQLEEAARQWLCALEKILFQYYNLAFMDELLHSLPEWKKIDSFLGDNSSGDSIKNSDTYVQTAAPDQKEVFLSPLDFLLLDFYVEFIFTCKNRRRGRLIALREGIDTQYTENLSKLEKVLAEIGGKDQCYINRIVAIIGKINRNKYSLDWIWKETKRSISKYDFILSKKAALQRILHIPQMTVEECVNAMLGLEFEACLDRKIAASTPEEAGLASVNLMIRCTEVYSYLQSPGKHIVDELLFLVEAIPKKHWSPMTLLESRKKDIETLLLFLEDYEEEKRNLAQILSYL